MVQGHAGFNSSQIQKHPFSLITLGNSRLGEFLLIIPIGIMNLIFLKIDDV
jgi:hypothetical protein